MYDMFKPHRMTLPTAMLLAVTAAHAGVTPEEAAKLKGELTPLGAEKAGNRDGSIPAWTGGQTMPIAGDAPGGRRGDPFKDEKPLFSVTAKNVEQHADRLTDGQKALFQKYPEYRIDVYKTHRTAAAPRWVYDNTFKNATRTELVKDIPSNVYGGIPFPIPKNGAEVMWNHMLRWRGSSWQAQVSHFQITTDGRPVMTTEATLEQQMAIYQPEGSWEAFDKSGLPYWQINMVNSGPAIRAGEAIVGGTALDGSKDQAWVYFTGQRRVRKLPTPCCDTPTPASAGLTSFDEIEVWTGRIDRFDWKVLGKKEMFIPYNGNRLLQPKTEAEVLGAHYVNPNFMRWELHRVWVVEATLRSGQRHQSPKGRYYCDEDTWQCTLGDRWDSNGQLWKTLWFTNFVAPDLPGTVGGANGFNDLLTGSAFVSNLYNSKPAQYVLKSRYPDSTFTPDALVRSSVR
jgi:hypothetical protein